MSAPAYGGGEAADTSRSDGRSRNTRVDPLIRESIHALGTYHNWQRFAAMRMNGQSASMWNVRFQHNPDSVVDA